MGVERADRPGGGAPALLGGRARQLAGCTAEVVRLPGRTPCVLVDVAATPGEPPETTLVYGHLDKQPPLGAWREGFEPFRAVRVGDLLYGRGTSDDGYALFAALGALEALEAAGVPHGRVLVLIEAAEESGSTDLEAYLDALAGRIGPLALVVSLDSGCATYDRLWITTSLRGTVNAILQVRVTTEGVHSGMAGGVVPSSFRVLRQLLDRLEDATSGRVLVPGCDVEIPPRRSHEIEEVAAEFGDGAAGSSPSCRASSSRATDAPSPARPPDVAGGARGHRRGGLPRIEDAGNVLRPSSTVKLSLRTPPTADALAVAEALRVAALTRDPPSGADISPRIQQASSGWDAPELPAWLTTAIGDRSVRLFRQGAALVRLGRVDPVRDVARPPLPGGSVRHDRRARPRVERARSRRVPPHPDGQDGDVVHGPPRRRPRGARSRRPPVRGGEGLRAALSTAGSGLLPRPSARAPR